jgi:hypothetical protein
MGEGPVPQPQQKLTILEEQLGLLMIFDVVHLAVGLVGQVHAREVFVLAEHERESRLHPASGEEAVFNGAFAFEEVAQLGGADAEAQLGDCGRQRNGR